MWAGISCAWIHKGLIREKDHYQHRRRRLTTSSWFFSKEEEDQQKKQEEEQQQKEKARQDMLIANAELEKYRIQIGSCR